MLYKQISKYLKGQLSELEAMDLWARILQQPKCLEYLITEMQLLIHFRKE